MRTRLARALCIAVLMLSSAISAWAEFTWPTESVPIRINGESIPAFWKDGAPYVQREKVVHIFHIRTGDADLNLVEALKQQGYTCEINSDGSVAARKSITIDTVHPSGEGSYTPSYSTGSSGGDRVNVKGYTRKDGTYVAPYTRSKPKN